MQCASKIDYSQYMNPLHSTFSKTLKSILCESMLCENVRYAVSN